MPDEKAFKSFVVELKEDGEVGEFIAKIATLDVMDHDRDVTRPGAFPEGKAIQVGAFNHSSSMGGVLPIGVAKLHEEGKSVFANGRLNLGTDVGMDHYRTIKFAKEHDASTEWSYGYIAEKVSFGEFEGQQVRFLEKLKVFEVGPVMMGAGLDTGTLVIKEHRTFQDHAAAVLAAVAGFTSRAESLADLRGKEGRDLSTANKERLVALQTELGTLQAKIIALLEAAGGEGKAALGESLWLAYQRTQAQLVAGSAG